MTAPARTAADGTAAPAPRRWRIVPLLPARLRPLGRPKLWAELVFAAVGYWAYGLTRNAVPAQQERALQRARWIWRTEQHLHIGIERTVNHAADHVGWLIVGMNYYYATLHFIVTTGVLVWLCFRRPAHYRAARTALYAATLLALAGFTLYALAPPRFLTGEGFIDTVVVHHTWGSWASGDVAQLSNQDAAMPSVHIVWSAWCGTVLFHLARRTWVRALGVLYPLATFTVIIATANHFITDAVAGAATLAVGFLVQRVLTGRPAYPRARAAGQGNQPGRG
ncbi:phosphatase PAP2 family protein [Streptomyces sp. ET3-23]|uniref:phosphatase PAP2 family protein n=1 Tax=Streptomyces sp. ET3-23 TaxID=2885643 RepID=UPI001D1213AF|nr:phosphatase PAP2 family protein [Streptomyces sp. ET3-23]MCC2275231.1 phosphatase PAP2 family protein [Streptomyces sp. ET3-23]